MNADVVAAARDCGVTIAPDESTSAAGAITIAFDGAPPACAGDDAPTAARPLGDAPPTKDQ